MRLIKFLLVTTVAGCLIWVTSRAVRVETTAEQVRITINRKQLREAGSDLKSRGRHAMTTFGEALQQAGEADDGEPEVTPAPRFWQR